jgi:sugar phosphate isomerase/epimerase
MRVSIRCSYPEKGGYDWPSLLQKYEKVGWVEVAFYRPEPFRSIKIEGVVRPFQDLALKADSVHMAHERITEPYDFLHTLKRTMELTLKLDCNKIVVHPSKARLSAVREFIDAEVTPLLEESKINLCWETFESKRRVFSGIDEIAEFCKSNEWHSACYDFSHIFKEQEEVIAEIEDYINYIKIFHLSNRWGRKQHLPVFSKGDLNFAEILDVLKEMGYNGSLVLEYLPEYHDQLLKDALKIQKFVDGIKPA